jgi:hypothetical protein
MSARPPDPHRPPGKYREVISMASLESSLPRISSPPTGAINVWSSAGLMSARYLRISPRI